MLKKRSLQQLGSFSETQDSVYKKAKYSSENQEKPVLFSSIEEENPLEDHDQIIMDNIKQLSLLYFEPQCDQKTKKLILKKIIENGITKAAEDGKKHKILLKFTQNILEKLVKFDPQNLDLYFILSKKENHQKIPQICQKNYEIRPILPQIFKLLQIDFINQSQVINLLLNTNFQCLYKVILQDSILLNGDSVNEILRFFQKNLEKFGLPFEPGQLNLKESEIQSIIKGVFVYINRQLRSLDYKIRQEASRTLSFYPVFLEEQILKTIQKEQLDKFQENSIFMKHNSKKNQNVRQLYEIEQKVIDQILKSETVTQGSLIHLLEDEYHEIRINGIKSIENFSLKCVKFRILGRELLFYMLNDENNLVRVQSLRSLKCIFSKISLDEKEVKQLMFNVKESIISLRLSIYSLLENVKFEAEQGELLMDLTEQLQANILKFGQDKLHIYKSLSKLGQNNSELVMSNIEKILKIEDINYIQVPRWNENVHIARIIILQNALAENEQNDKLPHYFQKHIVFMKENYGKFFKESKKQNLKSALEANKILKKEENESKITQISYFLVNKKKIQQIQKKLKHMLKKQKISINSSPEIQSMNKLSQIIEDFFSLVDILENNNVYELFHQLQSFNIQQKLQNIEKFIQEYRFQEKIQLQSIVQYCESMFQIISLCLFINYDQLLEEFHNQDFIKLVQNLLQKLKQYDINSCKSLQDLYHSLYLVQSNPNHLTKIESRQQFFESYFEKIKALLKEFSLPLPKLQQKDSEKENTNNNNNGIQKKEVQILEPLENQTIEIRSKYQPILHISVSIKNLDQKYIENLVLVLEYQNGDKEIFSLKEDKFTKVVCKKLDKEYVLDARIYLNKFSLPITTQVTMYIIDMKNLNQNSFQGYELMNSNIQEKQNIVKYQQAFSHKVTVNIKPKFNVI